MSSLITRPILNEKRLSTVRAINLAFTTASATASGTINVPFEVNHIKFKSMVYFTASAPATPTYIYMTSNLTGNNPIGTAFFQSTYPSTGFQDVTYVFYNPIVVSGDYNFTINLAGGALATPTGNDLCTIIAEFHGGSTPPAN